MGKPRPLFFHDLRIQALIFDNDGTLVDTERVWSAAYTELLGGYHLKFTPSVHRLMMGQSPRACVETLQQSYRELPQDESGLEELLQKRQELFQRAKARLQVTPLPGVQAFLEWAFRQGFKLALCTSATSEDILSQCKALGWSAFFDEIVTADDVKAHKPAPDPYLLTMKRLKLESQACVAFEDATNGLLSARAAGMPSVFVRDERFGVTPPFTPWLTVSSFTELLPSS